MPKDTQVWREGTTTWLALDDAVKPPKDAKKIQWDSETLQTHDPINDEVHTLKGEGSGGRSHKPTAALHNSKKKERLFNPFG